MPSVESIVEDWKAKLIDLTSRNRLLFFRPGRLSALEVLQPSVDAVFTRLVVSEKDWQFLLLDTDSDESDQLDIPSDAPPREFTKRHPRKAHELVCRLQGSAAEESSQRRPKSTTLNTVLRSLYRKSRTDYEERGITTLHLTFGMLEWQDRDDANTILSPLVLVPVRLERLDSLLSPFRLSLADDDITVNPAIRVKLWNDFHLAIPPDPEDWDETTLQTYLMDFHNKVKGKKWKVKDACWLCTLSYHKLVIYQDLNKHSTLVGGHSITQALAEEGTYDSPTATTLPESGELDRTVLPQNSHLILDADSSQLCCIEAAKKGIDLVIQGPPGTGKSQTIANVIAESIAAGRKVLFVSEKMAALEVVLKRLTIAKLDHYCLVLHSHKANKRDVVTELERCFKESQLCSAVPAERDFRLLQEQRGTLNEYVLALHLVRKPMGKSVYQVLGVLSGLHDIPFLPLKLREPGGLTLDSVETAASLAGHLGELWHIITEWEQFPWVGCSISSYNPHIRSQMANMLASCIECTRSVQTSADKLAGIVGTARPTTLTDVFWLQELTGLLATSPGIEEEWLSSIDLESLRRDAKCCSEIAASYDEVLTGILESYHESFLSLTPGVRERIQRAESELSLLTGKDIAARASVVQNRASLLECIQYLASQVELWKRDSLELAEYLGVAWEDNVTRVRRLHDIVDLCNSEEKAHPAWFEGENLAKARALAKNLKAIQSQVSELKSALCAKIVGDILKDYHESFLSLNPDLREEIRAAVADTSALIGNDVTTNRYLVPHRKALIKWAQDLTRWVELWERDGAELAEHLGVPLEGNLTHVRRLVNVVNLCNSEEKAHPAWFEGENLAKARALAKNLKAIQLQVSELKSALFENCDEGILSLDCGLLLHSFESLHGKRFSWLHRKYRIVNKTVKQLRRPKCKNFGPIDSLRAGSDIQALERKLSSMKEECSELLGTWFQGDTTDFESMSKAMTFAQQLLSLVGPEVSPSVASVATYGSVLPIRVQELADRIVATLKIWESSYASATRILNCDTLPSSHRLLEDTSLLEVLQWGKQLALSLQRLDMVLTEVEKTSRSSSVPAMSALYIALDDLSLLHSLEQRQDDTDIFPPKEIGEEEYTAHASWSESKGGAAPSTIASIDSLRARRDIQALERKLSSMKEECSELLGTWFQGDTTDFESMSKAMTFAQQLLSLVGPEVSPSVASVATYGSVLPIRVQELADRIGSTLDAWRTLYANVKHILDLEDLPGSRRSLEDTPFNELSEWATRLVANLHVLHVALAEVEQRRKSESIYAIGTLYADFGTLDLLSELEKQVHEKGASLKQAISQRWRGVRTVWTELDAALSWTGRLRKTAQDVCLLPAVKHIAVSGGQFAPDGDELRARTAQLLQVLDTLATNFDSENGLPVFGRRKSDEDDESDLAIRDTPVLKCDLQDIEHLLYQMEARLDDLRDWIDYRRLSQEFALQGLESLFAQAQEQPELCAELLPDIARRSLYVLWLDWVYSQDPILEMFRGDRHEGTIRRFRETDSSLRDFGHARVIAEAEARKPSGFVSGETALLMREANKKRRHLPIRSLLAGIPNLLFKIKPCLLMSPLSVSQYLDPEAIQFDVVVFDEASQVRPHEGIAAIYRGKQLVVCGDSKQLPPTAFFDFEMSEDYYDDDTENGTPDEYESLLDLCASTGLNELYLRWHYRSQHEDLIAFSNSQFYTNKLVTFPSPHIQDQGFGVEFVHVPEGVYDRGGRRDNPKEAEKVIEVFLSMLKEAPERSIGIVAFSKAQSEAIENQLELMLKRHPELQSLIKTDLLDGFFVKNLETVQGDERDVIILSVGYGRDLQGKMSMNFGPLNKPGGQKRLNVAITRARHKVVVVSSIEASDIDLSATQAEGVRQLYKYLDYAVRGHSALVLDYPDSLDGFESPFEESVAYAIREMGYDAVPQVGCSEYRIDIGVCLPDKPGRFILGIECDGAMYHSAHTARDRDRLRQEVLENLGWTIHRIWSPEWVSRRDTELKRLRTAIEAASRASLSEANDTRKPSVSSPLPECCVEIERVSRSQSKETLDIGSLATTYRPCVPRSGGYCAYEIHDPMSYHSLRSVLLEVVLSETPVHIEIAARRVADVWGVSRVGSRIMTAIEYAVTSLVKEKAISRRKNFLWASDEKASLKVRCPDPSDPDTQRKLDHISAEEIGLGVSTILEAALSLSEEELIVQTARLFGFQRTGNDIRARLKKVIKEMLKGSKLNIEAGRLVPGSPAS